MKRCDCDERIGIEIKSWNLFQELKMFFEEQVNKGIFLEVLVEAPYFQGYNLEPEEVKEEYKWYADKWYKCNECGTLWEIKYPDFPAKGFVRKFEAGKYQVKE
ncbi:hypothetical protein SAMN02746066_04474 [Anaerosporobacter mobilis DSM 15930]|jgi:hypothetical protein|uniref:Uncharacterized protein n=1 Tax=Anaerosporobacter mobilis DSM 15930 TaxID=1120996 RepID=A0A1M7NGF4_9FIRM|nr:hypothetical protein [Anaerosporobacter mobilis]SHN02736.1 hypothetical protein SAMN02746066_04474 [Anaerosporobacter mobilis DSM 15930]